MRADGLTDAEGVVADHLFDATEAWLELPEQHPWEMDEFLASIHRLQDMLATRVARRLFPDGWPTYSGEEEGEEAEVQGGQERSRHEGVRAWSPWHAPDGEERETGESVDEAQAPTSEAQGPSQGAQTPQPPETREPPPSLAEAARQVRERRDEERRKQG